MPGSRAGPQPAEASDPYPTHEYVRPYKTEHHDATLYCMVASTIRVNAVPVETLGAFVEACAAHSTSDLEQLGSYAGFSRSTARKAVPSLETLNIVVRGSDGTYAVAVDGVTRGMPDEAKIQIIRQSLLGFRPFEVLIEGIALGERKRDAIRKTMLLLGLPSSESAKFEILIRWAQDLGILESSDDSVALVAGLTSQTADELGALSRADVESEAKARLFNSRRLGRNANNYLDEVDRGLLADALLKYEADPRKSVDASGQALEDFLRHVADDAGYATEARKASGAGQLANLLYTKAVIHNHHQKVVDAVATVRNATSHRKDKKTLAPWELTEFGAFGALVGALTAIRSIHEYVKKGKQTI
jgi:hypothetical protein